MATLVRNQVPDALANMVSLGHDTIVVDSKGTVLPIAPQLEPEYQTDKDAVKIVPCRECHRPLVTTTFFAPAKGICRECQGETAQTNGGRATVGQPTPGQTDPAKAVNLADALVNKTFAQTRCPVHPDDDEHVMELVSVAHSEHYGPSRFMGWDKGKPVYQQTGVGETATLQCQHGDCKATVVFSTTAQQRYRRQNEPKLAPDLGRRPGIVLETLNGIRREED